MPTGAAGASQVHSEEKSPGATGAGAENTMEVSTAAQNTTRPIKPIELNTLILPVRNAVVLVCPLRTPVMLMEPTVSVPWFIGNSPP